ncbi:hypothetical protein [Isoptericola sp. NPDC057653]|uniref:hypothetical protein n=1 Tax=Isoptericola sp. NPDC057653 TaxID=3346195 RepID=UPI0036842890
MRAETPDRRARSGRRTDGPTAAALDPQASALAVARHDVAAVALVAPGAGPRRGGDGDEAPGAPADAHPADAKAPAPAPEKPKLTQSAVTIAVKQKAKALSQRGSAEYKVQWSVGGKKNGWVIQHLKFDPSVQDKDGKAVVARNTPTEYWEGWQVRDGKVYIGDSDQAHQSDTFRTISEAADTRGTILETGKVSFVEDYKLTKPPWGSTVPEAGSLPNMKAAPDGWSDGAAQDHTMTVTYDDVAKTPQDQVGNP